MQLYNTLNGIVRCIGCYFAYWPYIQHIAVFLAVAALPTRVEDFQVDKKSKLHALMETYHIPYNLHHRYWTGLLLCARVVLYLVAAVNDSNDPRLSLTSISFVVGSIFLLKGLMGGRLYQNKFVDIIETVFCFNILAFAILTWYDVGNEFNAYNWAIIYISVISALTLLLLIILYHFYLYTPVFSKVHKTVVGKKLDAFLLRLMTPIEMQQHPVPSHDDNIHAFNEFLDLVNGPVNTNDYELQPKSKPAEPTRTVVEIHIPRLAPIQQDVDVHEPITSKSL